MGENHEKPSGRKQSLCEVGSFNVLSIRKILSEHEYFTFPFSDLELDQMTLGQNHHTLLGHKQSFCQV